MTLDRRTVLASLSAVGLAGLPLGSGPRSAGTVRVRRSIAEMSLDDPDLDALRRAIPLMRKSGAWQAQVALHADMNNRQHASWRFLPWHRLQLVRFEEIVAKVSGKADFALPYWDWGKDPFPTLFRDDPAFKLKGRRAPRTLIMNSRWFTAKLDDPFATYFGAPRDAAGQQGESVPNVAGSAEWSGHNLAHGYIGGDMNDLQRAPNDPIFWLHHANIDRYWALWRRRNADEAYPRAWREEVLTGFIDADGRPAPAMTAGDTIEPFAFGYAYPLDLTMPPVIEPAPSPDPRRNARHSWSARLLTPTTGVVEIPASIADRRPLSVVGFVEIVCVPHEASMVTVTARRTVDGPEGFRDTIFAVPMGACIEGAAYRINLDQIWSAPGSGGIEVRIEVSSIRGPRARGGGTLRQAIVDAEMAATS